MYGKTLKMHTVQVIYYQIMIKKQNITNNTDPAGKQPNGVPVPVNPALLLGFLQYKHTNRYSNAA